MRTLKTVLLGSVALQVADAPATPGALEAQAIQVAKISAAQREAEIKTLAAQADNANDLIADLQNNADAMETLAMNPLNIMLSLRAAYTSEVMDGWPMPGTEETDADGKPTGINNPDWYSRPTKRKGGGKGTARASWCNEFAKSLKPCRDWQAEADAATERAAKNEIGVMERDGIVAKMNGRISSVQGKVRTAIALHHQLSKAQAYPALFWDDRFEDGDIFRTERVPVLDDDGKPVIDPKTKRPAMERRYLSTVKPVVLVDAEDRKQFYEFNLQQFCAFDFDAATAAGGTMQNLFDTAARGGGADDETGDGIVVGNGEQRKAALNALVSYLENKAFWLKTLSDLDKEGEDVDEELYVWNKMFELASNVVARHSKRLDPIIEKMKAA